MSVYKVIVTGPFNSGKTEFIKTISDIPVVTTEKNITTEDRGIKSETTVAMDFGRTAINNHTIHLFGTPGQTRFNFMWEILASEMNGFIVLVDSTDEPSFPEAAELIEQFSDYVNVPYLVVSNKTDLDGAASLAAVRRGAKIDNNVTVMPCVATQKTSVRQVILQVMDLLSKSAE